MSSPSGGKWTYNDPNDEESIKGKASDFCHVVTQGRNIKETDLEVVGDIANKWMSIAQCFAGGAEDPPKVGSRAG